MSPLPKDEGNRQHDRRVALLLLPAVALLHCSSFLTGNFPPGHDAQAHVARAAEFFAALEDGQIPPRWAPNLHGGLGYPILVFYPPLFDSVVALFQLLGFEFIGAVGLSLLVLVYLAALGMFLFARFLYGTAAATVCALSYVLASYPVYDLFTRCAFAEFSALSVLPFVAASLCLLARAPSWRAALYLSVSYAALILAHNAIALIVTPFVILVVLAFLLLASGRGRFLLGTTGILFAIGLAAWYWLPALLEREHIQYGRVLQLFPYDASFLPVPQLLGFRELPGLWPHEVAAAVSVTAYVVLALKRSALETPSNRAVMVLLVLFSATGVFMSMRGSNFVWKFLPILHNLQFPWRFLSLVSFGLAALVGGLLTAIWRRSPEVGRALGAGYVLCSAFVVFPNVVLREGAGWAKPAHGDDHVLRPDTGVAAADEFLPVWVEVPESDVPPRWVNLPKAPDLRVVEGSGRIQVLEHKGHELRATVISQARCVLEVGRLFFPGWLASIDGETTELIIAEHTGLMRVTVPPGEHTLSFRLGRTPARIAGELTSLLLLSAVTIAVFVAAIRRLLARSDRIPCDHRQRFA